MRTWQLRDGAEKRFRSGHPWVFSNELTASPKGTPQGDLIELTDSRGGFLAYGYGNPHSLIAFRTLSTNEQDEVNEEFFLRRFKAALELRVRTGVANFSHRLVFAENDYLPGLIIDRYALADDQNSPNIAGQIFVVQSSTAGMDPLLPLVYAALERLTAADWSKTGIIQANTSQSRALEGIKVEQKTVIRALDGVDLKNAKVLIQSSWDPSKALVFDADLIEGQKTGFFLDQRENIRLVMELLRSQKPAGETLRVLDLCCYIGQWSTQLANAARELGMKAELTIFDSSQEAIDIATRNIQRQGGFVIPVKGDVLQGLRSVLDRHYDIVICDPPAFIKKKKDVPTGKAAYQKLNREAQKRVKFGGIYVSCSCSGLFVPEEFRSMLSKVSYGPNYHVQWVKQGFHSPDHPQRLEFPEGSYLKCMVGILQQN